MVIRQDLSGKMVGGCRLETLLGQGAMGVVYRGLQVDLQRPVAVKIIPAVQARREAVLLLVSEARATAKLEHPNIAQVYNVGINKEFCYIIMQYIQGRTLATILGRKGARLASDTALNIVREVARGLQVAHANNIIHRDLKPDNIIVTDKGKVKIMDFGLSHQLHSNAKTKIAGTPNFMPPEQWEGKNIDARTDIYALGVTLYVLLTGQKPFEGLTIEEVKEKHLSYDPPHCSSIISTISAEINALVCKMIHRNPDKRYQDAYELIQDIERIQGGNTPSAITDIEGSRICPFCEAVNDTDATRCHLCNENLVELTDDIDLAMRDDEFPCPTCEEFVRRGASKCTRCQTLFCKRCHTETVKKEEYCLACFVWTEYEGKKN